MMKTFMKALIALTLTFGAAQANDQVTFGGTGVTLLPIKNGNITMVDEHIVLEGHDGDGKRGPGWKAVCTFQFKNETDKPQTVTMGFPFQRLYEIDRFQREYEIDDIDDDSWKETVSEKDATYLEQSLVESFTAKVRGVDVKPKAIRHKDKLTDYRNAWVWDVTFAPGETVEVINTYEHLTSESIEGYEFINHVLKTGKSWKGGKIGRLLFEVKPKKDFILEFDMEDSVLPKATRVEADGQFKKVVWDLKNFTPETDLYFQFYPAGDYLKSLEMIEDSELFERAHGEESCDKLRLNRNTYYAWYGYPFKTADLKAYFGKQWWYKEDPNFDVKKLSTTQQQILAKTSKFFKAIEVKKGCRK